MNLSRHSTPSGPRWACDGRWLPVSLTLSSLLALPRAEMLARLKSRSASKLVTSAPLAPLDPLHEVWAAGVTYLRSREARRAESATANLYDLVYEARRPELFFKASGWRAIASGGPARIRRDSKWNVPEPELVLVVNSRLEIVGYTAGNDLSSRDIEGENPLYLPQAKVYTGSCALGPAIQLAGADELLALPVRLEVMRQGAVLFQGETSTTQMKRPLPELVAYLGRELDFPNGSLLMTGTGIVPGADFSLRPGDHVRVQIGELTLENPISFNIFSVGRGQPKIY